MTEFFPSFAPLASRYDAFILDLWGVIHDGRNPYPGAKDCLRRLRATGRKIVLLSNAPRRVADAEQMLERMGIGKELYDALVTSGETAYRCLADAHSPFFTPGGKKYIYIGMEKDRAIMDGLDYTQTDDPAAAHFILLAHSYYDNQPEAELAPLLERCLRANLPALCINPDREVVRQTGERVYCAGAIAESYAAKGGTSLYFGKPHAIVYETALGYFSGVERSRILAVGDNMATDIKGAESNGLASALVTGGVLKETVGAPGTQAYAGNLKKLSDESGVAPDYALPAFNW